MRVRAETVEEAWVDCEYCSRGWEQLPANTLFDHGRGRTAFATGRCPLCGENDVSLYYAVADVPTVFVHVGGER